MPQPFPGTKEAALTTLAFRASTVIARIIDMTMSLFGFSFLTEVNSGKYSGYLD